MSVNIVIFTDSKPRPFLRYSGAYVIASALRRNGYTVQVVDHFLLLGLDRILTIIDKFVGSDTLFVGFSTTFMGIFSDHIQESSINEKMFTFSDYIEVRYGASTQIGFTHGVPISDIEMDAIRARIKEHNSKTTLVVGGTKANFLRQNQIDTFILGYADNSVVDYAKFLQGKNPFFQYTPLGDGRIMVDKDVEAIGYNFPKSSLFYEENDLIEHNEVLPIEISRGCIFKCKFCSYSMIGKKKNDYTKEKEVIYAEMMRNYEKFGTTRYSFADDTFNESVQKLEHFAEVFQRLPFKIEYVAYLRHDLIWRFPEMADILKESGLKSATFGIETLNHTAGKIIGKGLHPALVRETLEWLRDVKGWKNNILMSSGFIAGLPTETRDTVNAWVEEIMDFKYPLDSFYISSLFIFPDAVRSVKSEFERNYKEYGYYFDSTKSTGWINEHWKSEDAEYLATQMQQYAYGIGRTKSGDFQAMALYNHSHTWDDIYNMSYSTNKSDFYKIMKKTDEYYTRLINL